MGVRVRGVDGAQKDLRSIYGKLYPKRGGPVLAGMRSGGYVFRNEYRNQIKRQVDESQAAGSSYEPSGLMAKSVKVYRLRRPEQHNAVEVVRVTVDSVATYESGDRVAAIAGILENGRSDMPAKAMCRKAFDAKRDEAISVIRDRIIERSKKIIEREINKRR